MSVLRSGTTVLCGAALIATRSLLAQLPGIPPAHELGSRLAITQDAIPGVLAVRELSDGRVLVNDPSTRQLLLFDAALSHATIVADITPATGRAYGTGVAGLLGFMSDSSLLVDPGARAITVVTPDGLVAHALVVPRLQDVAALAAPWNAVFDGRQSVIYRAGVTTLVATGSAPVRPQVAIPGRAPASMPAAPPVTLPVYAPGDSQPLLRANLVTRVIDTAAYLGMPRASPAAELLLSARTPGQAPTSMPMQFADAWAVMSDGSIAILRGLSYHVDWVGPDGTRTAGPPIAHEWRRLSAEGKAALLDTIKQRDEANRIRGARTQDSLARVQGLPVLPPPPARQPVYPRAGDLPDFFPVFTAAGLRADADNRLWIRPGWVRFGDPVVYDIVDRRGILVDRVRVPPTLGVVGFGRGVIFVTVREGGMTRLAKFRIE